VPLGTGNLCSTRCTGTTSQWLLPPASLSGRGVVPPDGIAFKATLPRRCNTWRGGFYFPQDPISQQARSSTGYISADSSSLCMRVHANTCIATWLCFHRIRYHSKPAAQLDIITDSSSLVVYACARKYMYSHLALFPQDPTLGNFALSGVSYNNGY
jgi:hypothetical protein